MGGLRPIWGLCSLFFLQPAKKITGSSAIVQYFTQYVDPYIGAGSNGHVIVNVSLVAVQHRPHRYGTLREAFNHRMVFVYGTGGTKEENDWSRNKARYDAETWYYRGNGAVDVISDREFSLAKYKDRSVILFGNKTTNRAWPALVGNCPIQVERNRVTTGSKTWQGDDLSAYFVWPIRGSATASVGVISGSGIKGMNAANANQYFAGASGFPDFMIYSLKMLQAGASEVKLAGFYDHNWKLKDGELVAAD